jgi:hypothetical protein
MRAGRVAPVHVDEPRGSLAASRHQAGKVTEAERDAIEFALRQFVDVG